MTFMDKNADRRVSRVYGSIIEIPQMYYTLVETSKAD